jgi:hypothetical protein
VSITVSSKPVSWQEPAVPADWQQHKLVCQLKWCMSGEHSVQQLVVGVVMVWTDSWQQGLERGLCTVPATADCRQHTTTIYNPFQSVQPAPC